MITNELIQSWLLLVLPDFDDQHIYRANQTGPDNGEIVTYEILGDNTIDGRAEENKELSVTQPDTHADVTYRERAEVLVQIECQSPLGRKHLRTLRGADKLWKARKLLFDQGCKFHEMDEVTSGVTFEDTEYARRFVTTVTFWDWSDTIEEQERLKEVELHGELGGVPAVIEFAE